MKIALTGGGTAGHVNPNIALIKRLTDSGFEIIYIGSISGMERQIIESIGVPYFPIKTGKLRRYFDMKNVTDMARAFLGTFDAAKVLKREKVDIVFSKGGFVGLPVVLGAKMRGVPVVIHESDYSPGLANTLAIPFAKRVCVTFPETVKMLVKKEGKKKDEQKYVVTGTPIRDSLFKGDRSKGKAVCGFSGIKPVLLIMGGSLGSKKINEVVRNVLRTVTQKYDVVHICGKGNVLPEIATGSYVQFEYVNDELADILAVADVVISRAGANAINELLALRKPNILIPLSKASSRGDQILNARSFKAQGFSVVIYEETLTEMELLRQIDGVLENKQKYISKMSGAKAVNGAEAVVEVILDCVKGRI